MTSKLVTNSVMPKGVEHQFDWQRTRTLGVTNSVMPKGVQHVTALRGNMECLTA